MANTWIVVRLQGFYAQVERLSSSSHDERRIVVCTGNGTRALVLSVEEQEKRTNVRPGMRVERVDTSVYHVLQANPHKYQSMETNVLMELGVSLPEVQLFRPGIFASRWEGGRRFIHEAIKEAQNSLEKLGFHGGWGLAPEAAAAEIAAMTAKRDSLVEVPQGGVYEFLSSLPLSLLHDFNPRQLVLLREMGIHTFADLTILGADGLKRLFGPEGKYLLDIALRGHRREPRKQWRGTKRLSGDEDDPEKVNRAIANLLSEGYQQLATEQHAPNILRLTLLYADQRATSGVVQAGDKEHEGQWQKEALLLAERLWTRRVRIAQVRMSMTYGAPYNGQLRLFVPLERQERGRRLTEALGRVRSRWGFGSIQFAPSRLAVVGGEE